MAIGKRSPELDSDMPSLNHIVRWKTVMLEGRRHVLESWGLEGGPGFYIGPFETPAECTAAIEERAAKYVKVFFKEFAP